MLGAFNAPPPHPLSKLRVSEYPRKCRVNVVWRLWSMKNFKSANYAIFPRFPPLQPAVDRLWSHLPPADKDSKMIKMWLSIHSLWGYHLHAASLPHLLFRELTRTPIEGWCETPSSTLIFRLFQNRIGVTTKLCIRCPSSISHILTEKKSRSW